MMLDDLLFYRVGVTRKSRRYGGARKRTDQRCIMLREMSYHAPTAKCFASLCEVHNYLLPSTSGRHGAMPDLPRKPRVPQDTSMMNDSADMTL
jgi:hypothetical protein